ncbi:MAG: ester cyclase [Vicinamibacterales bacterium]
MADLQELLDQRTVAWNRRDAAALASQYSEKAVVSSPMFPRAEGRDAIENSFAMLFRIFPEWEITFERACTAPNRSMQLGTVRATQRGEFMGLPGSGRKVQFECVIILDFEDGQIVRDRRIYDFTGMLIQLGVLRGKPAL